MSSPPEDSDLAASAFALDRMRLVFVDRATERQFSHETLLKSLVFIRVYLFAGIALYMAFGILDAYVGAQSTQTLWFIRFAIVCPVLISVLIFTYLPGFPRFGQVALASTMLLSGLGIVAMTAVMPTPYNEMYYAGIIMVTSYCSNLIRLRLMNSVAIAAALVGAYQVAALWINPVPLEILVSNDFFLIMATGVGLFSAYIQELYIRRSYASQKIIEARNESLKLLLFEADKANRAKNNFLWNMSHELRTPLNAIIGFSEAMGQKMLGPLGHVKYEQYVEDINASGKGLLEIISGILDLANAEAGRIVLKTEPCDLAQCVNDCVRAYRGFADSARVRLALDAFPGGIVADIDKRLFPKVVLNLLSNAIKFTPPGGSVEVGAEIPERGGLSITVRDTGIGIAAEDIARVQVPFEQVGNSHTRTKGGTGLGLPYAKKLVELHGGTLEIASEEKRGTTVTVWLPPERILVQDKSAQVLRAG